jgi:hypothetical protein
VRSPPLEEEEGEAARPLATQRAPGAAVPSATQPFPTTVHTRRVLVGGRARVSSARPSEMSSTLTAQVVGAPVRHAQRRPVASARAPLMVMSSRRAPSRAALTVSPRPVRGLRATHGTSSLAALPLLIRITCTEWQRLRSLPRPLEIGFAPSPPRRLCTVTRFCILDRSPRLSSFETAGLSTSSLTLCILNTSTSGLPSQSTLGRGEAFSNNPSMEP